MMITAAEIGASVAVMTAITALVQVNVKSQSRVAIFTLQYFIFKKYFVIQSIEAKNFYFADLIICSSADKCSLKAFSPAFVALYTVFVFLPTKPLLTFM